MKPHKAVENIQSRNARVEADKAWETSWVRRTIITLGTYVIIGTYLNILNIENAWLHALIPPTAYILSTLSLPFFKSYWIKNIYKPNEDSQ